MTDKIKVGFAGNMHYFECTLPFGSKRIDFKQFDVRGDLTDPERYKFVLDHKNEFDAWIFFRGEFLSPKYAQELKGVKINISTEPVERSDTLYCLQQLKGIPFDKFFHYDKTHMNFIKAKTGIEMQEFQLPVDLTTFKPLPVRNNPSWDVGFLGRSTDARERHFDLLTPRREAYMGCLKNNYHFLHIAHGMHGSELNALLNRTAISLNIHIGAYNQLENRVQKLLAAGCFVLSEKLTHETDLVPHKHFVPFGNATDLRDEIAYYLENKEEREKIADAGRARVEERFDAVKQWEYLLEEAGL